MGRREKYDTKTQKEELREIRGVGRKEKKRLREEPLGMCTQQKHKCLASLVTTQFYRACCLNTLTAT